MDIITKMQEFNTLVDRKNKGEKFLNNPDIADEEKIKNLAFFLVLQDQIFKVQSEIGVLGYRVTSDDYYYGIGREMDK